MLQKILISDPRVAVKILNSKGRSSALKTFKDACKISAYKNILTKNKINIESIKSVNDFKKLPILDKENYIRAFPIEERSRFEMHKNYTIERSSGYSGEPSYWVRFTGQDDVTEKRIVQLIDSLFQIKQKKTLIINTFAMGTWIAGIKTARWFLNAANKSNLDLTVVNVGINLDETIDIFNKFHSFYDQTIFMGYNPFLKQIVERISGMYKKDHIVHLLMGGEGFSEAWRDYVASKLDYKIEDFKGKIISGYGAADMGNDIGVEQPFSIMLRRAFASDSELRHKYFGNNSDFVPIMFQYSPTKVYIETNKDGELILTANSGTPLVRYNLHDKGGTINYSDALKIMEEFYGKDYVKKVLKPMPLPIVYLYGRSDSTVHVVGVNIYLEHLKQAISSIKISNLVSGRFYSFTEEDANHNQIFNLVIEARNLSSAKINNNLIKDTVIAELCNLNKEYKHLYETNPKLSSPQITFISKNEFEEYSKESIKIIYQRK